MRQLAAEYGVRVVQSGGGEHGSRGDGEDEDEDEDEDWEEVVSALGNPWDMRPGRVDLLGDLEEASGRGAAAPQPQQGQGQGQGDAGSPFSPPSSASAVAAAAPPVSPYLDPAALRRIGGAQLLQLLREAGPGGGPQVAGVADAEGVAAGSAAAGGGGVAGAGGGGGIVLLDVREAGEVEEEAAEAQAGLDLSGGSRSALPPLPSGAPPPPLLRVPLRLLRREDVARLRAAAAGGEGAGGMGAGGEGAVSATGGEAVVVVLSSGDHRGEQAVVRLTRVYGMQRVVLYDSTLG